MIAQDIFENANPNTLKRHISANEFVLVDFWARACPPCKVISMMLPRLSREFPHYKIVKVDTDTYEEMLDEYDIYSLPSLLIFKCGLRVDTLKGKVPYTILERALKRAEV